ncbi:hypothetical protein ACVBEQ_25045 [Nakamurella sp. GG22]
MPSASPTRNWRAPGVDDIAGVRDLVLAARGSLQGYDIPVWAEVSTDPATMGATLAAYAAVGATWWIETAKPGVGWWQGLSGRIARGV